jgi:poly-gamma-glutamate capsule biosynthesis protein CapA/YwtB (metallophosphatase superfamily)
MSTSCQQALMRSAGITTHSNEAAHKRGSANRSQQQLNRAWEATNPSVMTEADYRALVLPGLREVRLSAIMRAVGISKGYAAQLKKGDLVPHPRVREALNTLVTGGVNEVEDDRRSDHLQDRVQR